MVLLGQYLNSTSMILMFFFPPELNYSIDEPGLAINRSSIENNNEAARSWTASLDWSKPVRNRSGLIFLRTVDDEGLGGRFLPLSEEEWEAQGFISF